MLLPTICLDDKHLVNVCPKDISITSVDRHASSAGLVQLAHVSPVKRIEMLTSPSYFR